MSDTPEQPDFDESETGQWSPGDEQLARLVPETDLKRLREERDRLAEVVTDLRAENQMLEQKVSALERRIEQKETERQQLIENYERIIEQKHREYQRAIADDSGDTDSERPRLSSILTRSTECNK